LNCTIQKFPNYPIHNKHQPQRELEKDAKKLTFSTETVGQWLAEAVLGSDTLFQAEAFKQTPMEEKHRGARRRKKMKWERK